MKEVKKILEQIGDFGGELSGAKLEEELNTRSRLLGKKQSAFSINSEEYKEYGRQRELVETVLKMLRDKARAESALVPVKEEKEEIRDNNNPKKQSEETDYVENMVQKWEDEYTKALKQKDTETLKKIYCEVSRYAEAGNAQAINMLGILALLEKKNKGKVVRLFYEAGEAGFSTAKRNLSYIRAQGILCKKNLERARTLIEEAAEEGNTGSMYHLALEKLLINRVYEYSYMDREKAYDLLKRYIQNKATLDMEDDEQRHALYLCYKTGYELKLDMDKEDVAEPLSLLLKHPGKYTEEAKGLQGAKQFLVGDYDEAIQSYLEHQTVDSIKAIEHIFFNKDFAKNRERQRQLDKVLENLRDEETTDKDVRIELYDWYGWRYEYGKAKLLEKAMAFWCYYKQSVLLGKDVEKFRSMIEQAKKQMDTVFLEEVIEKGAYDVSVDAGFIYRRRRVYDKALAHYRMAYEYAENPSVRERAKNNFEILKRKVDRQRIDMEECEPVYRQFMAAGLGPKLEAFRKMQYMIYRGKYPQDRNTYACLRVAQIVETDAYIQDCLKGDDAYTPAKILWLYQQTEDGDLEEGVRKLYEIYSQGLYGEKKDMEKADYYRSLLA